MTNLLRCIRADVVTAILMFVAVVGPDYTWAGTVAYVANKDSQSLSVLDMSTNTVTTTVPLGATPEAVAVSSGWGTPLCLRTGSRWRHGY